MTDRPILFSAPMIRALLEGRKTQTRRIIAMPAADFDAVFCEEDGTWSIGDALTGRREHKLPVPFRKGDRLWVKETWRTEARYDALKPIELPSPALISFDANYLGEPNAGCRGRTRVSIHMPRWASRLTLTVTDVRVQRLQECSMEDALAEGIDRVADNFGNGPAYRDYSMGDVCDTAEWFNRPVDSYASLWDHINGEGSWEANPWIVALTVTVKRGNIDAARER